MRNKQDALLGFFGGAMIWIHLIIEFLFFLSAFGTSTETL